MEFYIILHQWNVIEKNFSGEKWQQRRKILTPAFHFNILKDYIGVFNEKAEDFLNVLRTKAGEEVNVVPLVQEFSLIAING